MPTSITPAATCTKPTEAEVNFILLVLANQKSKPMVDWTAFASAHNFSNANSARTRWNNITKRLGWEYGSSAGSAQTSSESSHSFASRTSDSSPGGSFVQGRAVSTPSRKRASDGATRRRVEKGKGLLTPPHGRSGNMASPPATPSVSRGSLSGISGSGSRVQKSDHGAGAKKLKNASGTMALADVIDLSSDSGNEDGVVIVSDGFGDTEQESRVVDIAARIKPEDSYGYGMGGMHGTGDLDYYAEDEV